MFLPGQKVVCLNDEFTAPVLSRFACVPIKGETYTVRDVVPGCDLGGNHGEVAVYLVGLVNPQNLKGVEYGFNAERFAPLEALPGEEVEMHDELAAV